MRQSNIGWLFLAPATLILFVVGFIPFIYILYVGFFDWNTNAVDPTSYDTWSNPGAIVWSPFSNLWLYGTTTDVPSALAREISLCIGSDWGPSGTRNVLGELKVASLVSEAKGWRFSPFDLVKMITANPGDVLAEAWQRQAGRLQPGALGDMVVIASHTE